MEGEYLALGRDHLGLVDDEAGDGVGLVIGQRPVRRAVEVANRHRAVDEEVQRERKKIGYKEFWCYNGASGGSVYPLLDRIFYGFYPWKIGANGTTQYIFQKIVGDAFNHLDITPDGLGWVNANYIILEPANVDLPVINPDNPPLAPTATKEPPSGETVMATTTEIVNVYSGPGKDYEAYGKVEKGSTAEALGISADGGWIVLALPDITPDGRGWVNAKYLSLDPANVELPVVPAP